ncbi:MAG: DUF2132 domain-containing protein [Opitutaceae bacterium]|nr:DUF2132 domain-containing protein [Opitutaceae bacterium]
MKHSTAPAPAPSKDPLHGKTLERILTDLVAALGWKKMAQTIPIRCFMFDPSIKSSLVFLRRTPWARKQVEDLFLRSGLGGSEVNPRTVNEINAPGATGGNRSE